MIGALTEVLIGHTDMETLDAPYTVEAAQVLEAEAELASQSAAEAHGSTFASNERSLRQTKGTLFRQGAFFR